MATDERTMHYIRDQLADVPVSFRKMFGEYAVYLQGKVVGFICDNQLFVKSTTAGRALMQPLREGIPHPNAKPHLLVDEGLDDAEWLCQLLRATAKELPVSAPKKAGLRSGKATRQAGAKLPKRSRGQDGKNLK